MSRDRSPIHRVSASVSQLPFSAESFDIVQSVELFDSLPPVCFLIGKLGAKLLPQVTYKDGAFDLTLSPVDPSLLPLLRLKQTYNKQQKQTPLNVGRYQLVTCNVDAINVLSEISRVLRPGGVTLITDYVDEQPVGNYLDYIYFAAYNEQGKLGWDNYIFEQIADYSFPYQDISAQTEPLFLSWIGHTYGLSTDVFQSLESVKRMYFAPPDNKNDHRFRVTVLKKDN